MKLGILDQIARPKNLLAEETLAATLKLIERADALGYTRYWFAEHHGTKGMTATSPEIMMAVAASRTNRIKVGSGGILLPQYSPYKVASHILQLQALFPNRIEAGVGRSPGGTERIRSALANGKESEMDKYPTKLEELIRYLQGDERIQATPRTSQIPPLYSLGLGENSAKLAGELGIGYVFGHFIKADRGAASHAEYRRHFQSGLIEQPHALTAIFIICGETNEQAEEMALSQDLWLLNTGKGLDSRVPSIEEARAYGYTEKDKHIIGRNRSRMIVGNKVKVKSELDRLTDQYENEEWLIVTNVYDMDDKRKSYERIADLYL